MNTDKNTATLTINMASALSVQDVSIYDQNFEVLTEGTLTDDESSLTEKLAPGRYLVVGKAPSGRSIQERVTLSRGDAKQVQLNATSDSPHEWLEDAAARQELPVSDIRATPDIRDRSFGLEALKRAGTHPSIALGLESTVDRSTESLAEEVGEKPSINMAYKAPRGGARRIADEDGANSAITMAYKAPRSGGRRKEVVKTHRTDLRSYEWSAEHARWVRSDLVDRAFGQGSGDFLRLSFRGRDTYFRSPENSIKLLGAFRPGQPAKFIALPLFAQGVRILLTERYDRGSDRSSATSRISWRLSAENDHVDALLQSLSGRTYHDAEAVSRSALSSAQRALQEKLQDPEAAVVAGLVLLRHKQLDRRADWVENLAKWFPWLPDAQVLGAWSNLLFDTGDDAAVYEKLVKAHAAGPPQFAPTRKLLRDLLSTTMSSGEYDQVPIKTRHVLEKMWERFGRESRREIPGGPFYSFERSYGARS